MQLWSTSLLRATRHSSFHPVSHSSRTHLHYFATQLARRSSSARCREGESQYSRLLDLSRADRQQGGARALRFNDMKEEPPTLQYRRSNTTAPTDIHVHCHRSIIWNASVPYGCSHSPRILAVSRVQTGRSYGTIHGRYTRRSPRTSIGTIVQEDGLVPSFGHRLRALHESSRDRDRDLELGLQQRQPPLKADRSPRDSQDLAHAPASTSSASVTKASGSDTPINRPIAESYVNQVRGSRSVRLGEQNIVGGHGLTSGRLEKDRARLRPGKYRRPAERSVSEARTTTVQSHNPTTMPISKTIVDHLQRYLLQQAELRSLMLMKSELETPRTVPRLSRKRIKLMSRLDATAYHGQRARRWALAILKSTPIQEDGFPQVDMGSFQRCNVPDVSSSTVWQHAALSLLYSRDIVQMGVFLALTNVTSQASHSLLVDMFRSVAHAMGRREQGWTTKSTIAALLLKLVRDGVFREDWIPQPFLGEILTQLDGDQLSLVLQRLDDAGFNLSGNTRLHFVDKLAKAGLVERSAEQFRLILEHSCDDVYLDRLQSACATVLRAASQFDTHKVSSLDIIAEMVRAGKALNVQICNVVMLGAVEHGDVTTAFNVYDMLRRHGLTPSDYTFAILAKGCKADLDRPQHLVRVIREAIEDKILLTSPFVATEILHCLYRQHVKDERQQIFQLLLSAYKSMFDATPLVKLGLAVDEAKDTSTKRMQPSEATLGILIHAFLSESSDSWDTDPASKTWQIYQRLRQFAKKGDEPFAKLFKEDYVANAFAAYFGRKVESLPLAFEVIGDMREDHQQAILNPSLTPLDLGNTHDEQTRSATADLHVVDAPVKEQRAPTGLTLPSLQDTLQAQHGKDSFQARFGMPTWRTMSIMHHTLCIHANTRNQLLGQAEALFADLCKLEPAHDGSWLTMLNTYIRHEKWEQVVSCVEAMRQLGIWKKPHAAGPLHRTVSLAMQRAGTARGLGGVLGGTGANKEHPRPHESKDRHQQRL